MKVVVLLTGTLNMLAENFSVQDLAVHVVRMLSRSCLGGSLDLVLF